MGSYEVTLNGRLLCTVSTRSAPRLRVFCCYLRCGKNDIWNEDYIRLLIFVTLLLILVVFNCRAFARISTYGIHVVCSCFLVWYLYFYCACLFVFFFVSFGFPFNVRRNWISRSCYSVSGIMLFLLLLSMFSVGTSLFVARL